jgi:ketosteroid isomerase-like protein
MSDIDGVKAAVDEWNSGLEGGDIECMIATCDPKNITSNNGVATKVGTQAIRDKYEPLIKAYNIKSEWEYENIQFYGENMAIVTGFFGGEMTNKITGDVRGGSGRLVLVYRQVADGSWKMCLDMDNNAS